MSRETSESPRDRPVNPGDIAGGTYGRDKAEIARRSRARAEKDGARAFEPDDHSEPELDNKPEGRALK